MYQCLIQWQGDNVEVVQADASVSVATTDPTVWEIEDFKWFSRKVWEGDFIQVFDEDQKPIQAIGSESLF